MLTTGSGSLEDIDQRSASGWTALMASCEHNRADVCQLLLELGATVNCRNNQGDTALLLASRKGHERIVRTLVAAPHSQVNYADLQNSYSCLHYATKRDQIQLCRFLIAHQADINQRDLTGWTPLCHAAYLGCTSVLELLLIAKVRDLAEYNHTGEVNES